MLLASITCAEANASTLGNNQSKGIMDWEEELQGFFLSAKGVFQPEKLEGNSVVASFSISTFQAEPGHPADLPHHPFFLGSQFCHASAPYAELGLAPKGLIPSAPAYPFYTTPSFPAYAK